MRVQLLRILVILLLVPLVTMFRVPVVRSRTLISARLLSTPSTSSTNSPTPPPRKPGLLQQLPAFQPPDEHLNASLKKIQWLKPDPTIKNAKLRAQKQSSEKLQTLTTALSQPILERLKRWRYTFKQLHPFDDVVLRLTVSNRVKIDGVELFSMMDKVDDGRKRITKLGKELSGGVKNCERTKDINDFTDDAVAELLKMYKSTINPILPYLNEYHKLLRTTPLYDFKSPTLLLIGAPNVGKSSLVRRLSSGKPEVNDYSFTTKSVTIGHKIITKLDEYGYEDKLRCQVMDSPGVLLREGKANDMEELTVKSAELLPTAVMFVWDLSKKDQGTSNFEVQKKARETLRSKFPRRPWFDVITKIDVLDPEDQEMVEEVERICKTNGEALHMVSAITGEGLEEVEVEVERVLTEVGEVLEVL
ncbi:hypothetical protein TrST_g517 [Triparma strigata]|uniref:GTP-binding protein n=2 Tax=Triparma TaxID=722752 RepID=A0A9W7AB28_9STRA|nr:hypothetical protein TrST_g517 [Triparma strigata]